MRIREEAKRQGDVLRYHRIHEKLLVSHGAETGDPKVIVLEKLFASIRERL